MSAVDASPGQDAGTPGRSDAEAPQGPPVVEIGVPDAQAGLDFEPLPPGGEIFFSGGGQGGLLIQLALRCMNLGDAAFIELRVVDLESGTEAVRQPWPEPDALTCSDDGTCTYLPALVGVGVLGDPSELDGMRVRIEAELTSPSGALGSAQTEAILRMR